MLFAVGIVLLILAPLAGQLIKLSVSRNREYLADAQGVMLTRYPPGLISALQKISAAPHAMRAANNATAHLWLDQPSRVPGQDTSTMEQPVLDAPADPGADQAAPGDVSRRTAPQVAAVDWPFVSHARWGSNRCSARPEPSP